MKQAKYSLICPSKTRCKEPESSFALKKLYNICRSNFGGVIDNIYQLIGFCKQREEAIHSVIKKKPKSLGKKRGSHLRMLGIVYDHAGPKHSDIYCTANLFTLYWHFEMIGYSQENI